MAPPSSVEASGPTTVLIQPPGPAAPLPAALAAPQIATAPAGVRAAVGSAPALVTNGFMAGSVGPEIPGIAIGVNVVISYVKNLKFFHEQLWTVPLLIVLSFGIGICIWYIVNEQHNLQTAITNSFSILGTSHLNYVSSKTSGLQLLEATKEENRWHPKA